MNRIKSFIGFALCVLMLLGCMPHAFGIPEAEKQAEPVKQTAQEEVDDLKAAPIMPEAERGNVYYDRLWQISLEEAVNPADAVHPVGILDTADWAPARFGEVERAVAGASIPAAAGTYTRTMTTETLSVPAYCNGYIGFNALVYRSTGDSFKVICTDMDSGAVWEPNIGYISDGSWYEYSFPIFNNYAGMDYTQGADVRVSIVYTCTVSTKGGEEPAHACYVTDLGFYVTPDLDSAANAPDSDLHFTLPQDNSREPFDSCAYYSVNRHFVCLTGNSDDFICGVTAHVVAKAGDKLSYEFVSDLDYMNGTSFFFGVGTSYQDMDVIYSGDESGNGELWYDWESYEYTIPSNGEYDFIWVLTGSDDNSSYAYIDNIRVTPRMSKERVLGYPGYSGEDATYSDASDTPWYPVYYQNEFCLRSGNIGHGQTSTFISEHNMLKAEDWVEFRVWISSEQNYDKFTAYAINEITGEENVLYTNSGIFGGWVATAGRIGQDGIYTIKFVYAKDDSVSSGSDCVYIDFVDIPDMTKTHAAVADWEQEDDIHCWDYYPETRFHFVPMLLDGGVVLASDNRQVPDSTAYLYVDMHLGVNDAFSFDYIKDGENNYDKLIIELLDAPITTGTLATIKPRTTDWTNWKYVALAAGDYSFCITYVKDGSVNTGTDTAYIRNMRVYNYDSMLNEAALYDYQGVDILHYRDGGYFDTMYTDDGRFVISYTGTSGTTTGASINTYQYQNGFEYFKFDYMIDGDASIVVAAQGVYNETLEGDTNGEWQTFYYRIPSSGNWTFIISAYSSGGTIYIDDFVNGNLDIDFIEALQYPGEECIGWSNIENNNGFYSVYDPLEPNGRTEYACCTYDEGTASFEWVIDTQPGDYVNIVLGFRDEDGTPNGSNFELYQDGEYIYSIGGDSGIQLNKWYRLRLPVLTSGPCHFKLVYIPDESAAGGDAFCIYSIYRTPIGVTLDEALNVEGGDIHFTTPNGIGSFIPCVADDIAYAVPYEKYSPADPNALFSYSWDFESAAELSDWVFIDSDGDGYCWHYYDAGSDSVSIDAYNGTGVLCSDSYVYDDMARALDPDNWALSPEISIPEDAGHVNVRLMYSGCNETWYAEHFGVYVGMGTDVSTYTFLFDTTISSSGWQNLAFSVPSEFEGQNVRVALRHYDSYNIYRLMIDEFEVWNSRVAEATVSFEYDVSYGDEISFDVMCAVDDEIYAAGVYLCLWINGEPNYVVVSATELLEEYGSNTWVTYSCTIPFSGHVTFMLREDMTVDDYNALCLDIDNVRITRQSVGLPGDVNCDGEISFLDVSALYLFLIGNGELTEQGEINADFNGDGVVSFLDISDLNLYLTGD